MLLWDILKNLIELNAAIITKWFHFSNSKRRLAQKYLGMNDPDYYEWETHIFFDDAFKKGSLDAPDEKPVISI